MFSVTPATQVTCRSDLAFDKGKTMQGAPTIESKDPTIKDEYKDCYVVLGYQLEYAWSEEVVKVTARGFE